MTVFPGKIYVISREKSRLQIQNLNVRETEFFSLGGEKLSL